VTIHPAREEGMFQDVLYGVRILLKNKGWTLMVVLSLGLGIGANTALFSAINGMILKKLPVSDPDSLVRFRSAGPSHMSAAHSLTRCTCNFARTTRP
jgi:putative ABC transport system permease protein